MFPNTLLHLAPAARSDAVLSSSTIGSGPVLGGQPCQLLSLVFNISQAKSERKKSQNLLEEPARVPEVATSGIPRRAENGKVAQAVESFKLSQTVSVIEVKPLLGVLVRDEELDTFRQIVDTEPASLAGCEPALQSTPVATPALAGILGMVVDGASDCDSSAAITMMVLRKCWGGKGSNASDENAVELHVVVLLGGEMLVGNEVVRRTFWL